MSRINKTMAQTADLAILQLAALAIDVRAKLTPHHLQRTPSLAVALAALDEVLEELGWSEPGMPANGHEPVAAVAQEASPRRKRSA